MAKLIPEDLKRSLSKRQCVAFVGAGFSTVCGMPGWGAMLQMLLNDAKTFPRIDANNRDNCQVAIDSKNFTIAADFLRKRLEIKNHLRMKEYARIKGY